MKKEDATKIRSELEQQYSRPTLWSNTKKFLNSIASPKETLGFGMSGEYTFFLPKETRKKIVEKLKLPDYTERLYNKALVQRYLKKHDYLGAYEAFFSTWNPPAQRPTKEAYKLLGGNKHPLRASAGAWTYSILNHVLLFTPAYAAEALLGHPNLIIPTAGAVAGINAIGAAIATYSKWKHLRQNKPI